jgi:hypothetical protein
MRQQVSRHLRGWIVGLEDRDWRCLVMLAQQPAFGAIDASAQPPAWQESRRQASTLTVET